MGAVGNFLGNLTSFVKTEVLPFRDEMIKAGFLDKRGGQTPWEPKSNLVDPFAYNFQTFGYKERWSFLDYQKLRAISYQDPVVAAIIQTRMNQAASFAVPQRDRFKIGYKVRLRDHKAVPTKQQEKRADEMGAFIMQCGTPETFEDTKDRKKRDNLDTFLRKIVRDSLTFDQVNFEVVPRRDGTPAEFLAVDASTVRLIADRAELKDSYINPQTISQIVTDRPGDHERPTDVPRLCQVIRGTIHTTYDEWEMAFGVRNPRTDIFANGYGFSEIEMLMATVAAHINAETYNRKFFSQGAAVKGVITFEGAVPPDQLEAFRRQWHQQVSGVQNSWRTPILSLGKDSKLNWTSFHSTNREMEWGKYMEYLIKSICGVYQIDPIEIGFDISRNPSGQGSGLSQGGGYATDRIAYSQDKGLAPLLRFVASLLNDYIIWRIDPDFEFEFVGLDANDEHSELDIEEKAGQVFKTIDEIRAEHDLAPLPAPEDMKTIGQIIMNPTFVQALGQVGAAAQQMQQQAAGVGPDGQPLDPSQGQDGQDGQDEGDEPDYENMSTEELNQELARLQVEQKQGGAQGGPQGGQKPGQAQAPGQMPPQASKKPVTPQKPSVPPQNMKKSMKAKVKSLEIII